MLQMVFQKVRRDARDCYGFAKRELGEVGNEGKQVEFREMMLGNVSLHTSSD